MAVQFTTIELKSVTLLENNPRKITAGELQKLCDDITSDPDFLTQRPPLINRVGDKLICYAGQQRIKAQLQLGRTDGPAMVQDDVPQEVQDRRMVLDNTHRGQWDIEILQNEFGFTIDELMQLGVPDNEFKFEIADSASEQDRLEARQSLAERFLVPPFSILDSRQGYWQERKRMWDKFGINSQATREDIELIAQSGQSTHVYELRNRMREQLGREPEWDEIIAKAKQLDLHIYEGASIFDPVLCEVLYSWFCPNNAMILDPFAGGSVRGVVAAMLSHHYHGIDLRQDQIEANMKQVTDMKVGFINWYIGDSNDMDTLLNKDLKADFIFSCPPYHDLEKYSTDPADLSNMTYAQFLNVYQSIIFKSVDRLKDNRFACFVVGEIRDKQGMYRNFVGDTIQAFQDAGMNYYNEMILANVAGSLAIRVGRQFTSGRKIGKMHQNVLVFYKGDPKLIKSEFPTIEVKDIETEE